MSGDSSLSSEAVLTGPAILSLETAQRIAGRHYGLLGEARLLAGEKDVNVLIRRRDGRGFLLKVVHPGEDPAVTAMQTEALLHVARADPDMPVQRVVPTLAGGFHVKARLADGTNRAVRLVTFTEGVLQTQSTPSAAQRRNVGAALARLQRALEGFTHPADGYTLVWDLKHAADLRPLLSAVPDQDGRAILRQRLDDFEDRVAPLLAGLRTQVVHNDLNRDNVVVDAADPRIVRGVLDFGDIVRTASAADVAIGAAYQLADDDQPLAGALDFLAGFTQGKALDAAETDILFDLILMRLVMRILISVGRAARVPENRDDILRNTPRASAQLRTLVALPRQQALDAIGWACATGARC